MTRCLLGSVVRPEGPDRFTALFRPLPSWPDAVFMGSKQQPLSGQADVFKRGQLVPTIAAGMRSTARCPQMPPVRCPGTLSSKPVTYASRCTGTSAS